MHNNTLHIHVNSFVFLFLNSIKEMSRQKKKGSRRPYLLLLKISTFFDIHIAKDSFAHVSLFAKDFNYFVDIDG